MPPRLGPLLVLGLATAAHAETRRFALVVGSNRSDQVQAAPLLYADDDAVAMHELLIEAGFDSVLLTAPDEDTQRLHPGSQPSGRPTQVALAEAFEKQRQRMQEARAAGAEVEWLFFFSGHGDVDRGEGFLGLEQGRISRASLHEQLIARVPAQRIHVVIDACRSALMVLEKGPGGRRERLASALAAESPNDTTVGFVVSSSSARESHEWERFQSGVFSYEVRSALRGAADVDGDGAISYAELGAFLQTANRAIPSPEHRPDYLVVPPGGRAGLAAPLLSWADASAAVGMGGTQGHLYVERPSGERLLDVNAAPDSKARLFLPAERPLFVRASDETTERVVASAGPAELSALPVAPGSTRSKGALSSAFQSLFGSPFGAGAVVSWVLGWAPAETTAVQTPAPAVRLPGLRRAAGWTAIASAGVAAAALVLAHAEAAGGAQLSQQERVRRNGIISPSNDVSVLGLALASAAGAAWLGLSYWGIDSVAISPTGDGGGATFVLGGRFP